MRLTSWNLLHGLATPVEGSHLPQKKSDLLLNLSLEKLNPEILGLQEVDFHLPRSNSENQVEAAAKEIGAIYWAFAPCVIGSPDEKWTPVGREHLNLVTNENSESVGIQPGYGIGMVSKIPVKSWHRLELRRSPLGILMVLPVNGKLKRMYIRDHPRCAIAAVLENGWMVINTHLSFVPIFNLAQLLKIKRWVKSLPIRDKGKVIVMGDLNLPWDFFAKGFNWNSLAKQKTFPSWKPKIQFDYILSQKVTSEDVSHTPSTLMTANGISDHLPLTVDVEVD